jgi:hypothetical protein
MTRYFWRARPNAGSTSSMMSSSTSLSVSLSSGLKNFLFFGAVKLVDDALALVLEQMELVPVVRERVQRNAARGGRCSTARSAAGDSHAR